MNHLSFVAMGTLNVYETLYGFNENNGYLNGKYIKITFIPQPLP